MTDIGEFLLVLVGLIFCFLALFLVALLVAIFFVTVLECIINVREKWSIKKRKLKN